VKEAKNPSDTSIVQWMVREWNCDSRVEEVNGVMAAPSSF
jgi:hypothetical protein